MIKKNNNINPQENQTQEKSSTYNFFDKKRLKSPSNDLNRIKEEIKNMIKIIKKI